MDYISDKLILNKSIMIDPTQTVGQLVAEDFRRGAALRSFGIDFCCGGGKSLEEACARKGVNVAAVQAALEASDARHPGTNAHRFSQWSPAFLAQYIVEEHHTYVRDTLPVLVAFASKVAKVHGDGYPANTVIADLVVELRDEMEAHLEKEERDTFPLVGRLADLRVDEVQALLRSLEHEHEHVGGVMAQIRSLTEAYTPPLWACATWRALWAKLEEFEADLHAHVHLENNILFPKIRAALS